MPEPSWQITIDADLVGSIDGDDYGYPCWYWRKPIRQWICDCDVDLDYWFSEDGALIVIEFESRGHAVIFLSRFLTND